MRVTTRHGLAAWLDGLAAHRTLIAPKLVERELVYQTVTSSADIVFDFQRTALSPKTFFLPDTEVILQVEKQGRDVTLDEAERLYEQVLFGVRPCDGRGLLALDALLLDRAPPDAYYAARREKTSLIGLACQRLWGDCFCTSLGSGPDDTTGLDVMLHQDGDEVLVQVLTGRGEALLDGLETEETDRSAPASDTGAARVPVLPAEDWAARFGDAYWQRLADRCLSCHACTYVCPTCRCFDVRDETRAAGPGYAYIQRLRAWDSCLASAYRRIAGGHNPRPTKAQRLRNRYYCKFCYSPLDFGAVACVGCGRCIAVCPVGIDIFEMLGELAALEVAG
jgi:sulfhydrogenase subunit beta (sulfur reductase)